MAIEPQTKKPSKAITGIAGEYFVAAELSRRGFIATITLRNTEGIDIIASNPENNKMFCIQVKTNQHNFKRWMLTKKAEEYHVKNLFYVFVTLNEKDKHPEYFVFPGKVVADRIKYAHQHWLKSAGRNGQAHKDTSMREFKIEENENKDKWSLLR